jgi:hypothetical protein
VEFLGYVYRELFHAFTYTAICILGQAISLIVYFEKSQAEEIHWDFVNRRTLSRGERLVVANSIVVDAEANLDVLVRL